MKKIYKLIPLLLSISLLLTACSNAQMPLNTNIEKNIETESETPKKNNDREFNRPDMFGKVKSIIGNEVVLELAEMPEIQGKSGNVQKANGGNGQMSPEGMRVGNRQLKLTGETATLLIPVGIPITVRSQGDTKEVDIADIYEGAMLQIWFDESDKENETIIKVNMMQGR